MAAEIPTRDIMVWSGTNKRLIPNEKFEASLRYRRQPREVAERLKLVRIGVAKVLEDGNISQLNIYAEMRFLLDVVWGEQYRKGRRWIYDNVLVNDDQIPLDDQGHALMVDNRVNPEFSTEAIMDLFYHALRWLRMAILDQIQRNGMTVIHHADPEEWHDEEVEKEQEWLPEELKRWEEGLEKDPD